jgi:hypothetical protein
MRLTTILLLALLAPAGACAITRDMPADPPAVRPSEPFTIAPGDTVRVMDEDLAIEEGRLVFEEVLTDSRCPAGVSCVWAGEAQVRLTLFYGDGTVHEAHLEIPGMLQFGVPPDAADFTEIGGYTVRFLRLDPYPDAETGLPGQEDRTGIFVLDRLYR